MHASGFADPILVARSEVVRPFFLCLDRDQSSDELQVRILGRTMAADSPQGLASTLDSGQRAILACIFRDEQQLADAVAKLQQASLVTHDMRIGAADQTRAELAATKLGIQSDVDALDPLRGMASLSSESVTRQSVDRAGVIGAAIGVLAGFGLSFTPLAMLMPVERSAQTLALVAFWFVVGAIVGAVLGAAFAAQSSSHAGFRLIDGMQEGGLVLIIAAARDRGDALQEILESSGGSALTRL